MKGKMQHAKEEKDKPKVEDRNHLLHNMKSV